MFDLPEAFIEQMQRQLGAALPDFLHTYDLPYARGIRMRPGVPAHQEALQPVPWAMDAYYLPLESKAGATPQHEAGGFYLQEPSAMTAAAVLHPKKGEKVLDLCAAPGGKSTQLAAYLQGTGLLVCNEPVPGRAQVLSRNIERMGIPNALVTCALPEQLSPRFQGYFDKVLVDAPCSGEGMFRKHPEARNEWQPASPLGCAERQLHILSHAAQMLKAGGKLVYSTCTFNEIENEGVVQSFLQSHPGFSLVPFFLPGLPESGGMLHLYPHEIQGEGHFVALFQKNDGCEKPLSIKDCQQKPTKQESQTAHAFLEEHCFHAPAPTGLFAGHMISFPEETLPDIKNIRILRMGLQLGDVKGKLFLPDHALALCCQARKTVPVSLEEAQLYQNGQVLPCDENTNGWLCPVLDNLQLGWGKASQEQIKNHYPKGLRKPLL